MINGFEELQQTKEVKHAVKTAIVIKTDKYDRRGQAMLVWGSKFRVENNQILHETTGLFGNIWEEDYQYIVVSKSERILEIKGENVEALFFADDGLDYDKIQMGLAKAFLNPGVEKSRSTKGEREAAADADWQRRQDYEYSERIHHQQ